jgi:hypothetical protein
MTLEKFRILHSTLIEHYQYMEGHLEGLYAVVSEKDFSDALKDVEKDGLAGILRDILRLEREQGIDVLSDEECAQLQDVFTRRNFWCHNCYFDMVFDRQTGGPAKVRDVEQLLQDLKEAEQWRERLLEKKLAFLKQRGSL